MIDPFTAYAAYKATRKWVPYAVGAVGGLLIAGLLIGVPAYFMVSGARDTAAAMTLERDTYQASAENQAAAVKDRERSIDRLNAQAVLILNDWRDTRADAEGGQGPDDEAVEIGHSDSQASTAMPTMPPTIHRATRFSQAQASAQPSKMSSNSSMTHALPSRRFFIARQTR